MNWLEKILVINPKAPELAAINPAEASTSELLGDNFPQFYQDRHDYEQTEIDALRKKEVL